MEYYRRELAPCVWLTALRDEKFKTGCLSAWLLTQLDRATAADWAVLPYVLRRGTASLGDMRAIAARLEGLYGAEVTPRVRKLGEIQAPGFVAEFPDDRFLPGDAGVLESIAKLLGELWLSPNTRGGLLLPEYVDGERENLLKRLEALRNDRRGWAQRRLIENMGAFEPYAVGVSGEVQQAENIHYVKLTKSYRTLLSSAPMEFFYCGSRSGDEVAALLEGALLLRPRGEIDLDLGTDVRMNALEAEPRYFTETMSVTQGNLAMGFRLGSCMSDPDEAAIRVFNAVYGGCATSKLFTNVRERMSLCYYASSSLDLLKGIMTVSSGIDFDKYDPALNEILAQLESLRAGDISAGELDGAKRSVSNALRAMADSPLSLESHYLTQAIQGQDASPADMAALVEDVTAEEVAGIARGVELDAVYFLKGEAE